MVYIYVFLVDFILKTYSLILKSMIQMKIQGHFTRPKCYCFENQNVIARTISYARKRMTGITHAKKIINH